MIIHIVLLAYICGLGGIIYRGGNGSKRRNKLFLLFAFLGIFLVGALRGKKVGLDTSGYVRGFIILNEHITEGDRVWTVQHWEPGWRFLNYLVGGVTKNPQGLLMVTSLIICSGIAYFIYSNTDKNSSAFYPTFYFMTLASLYPMSMYLLRQFTAIVFLLAMYTVLRRGVSVRSFFISVILLLFAISFHYSAIIGVVIMIVAIRPAISKTGLTMLTMLALIGQCFFSLLRWFLERFVPLYAYYLNLPEYRGEELRLYSVVMALLRLLCCILAICLYNPKNKDNKRLYDMCVFSVCAMGCMLLQTQTIIAQRAGNYFEIFIILLIPAVLKKIKNNHIAYIGTVFMGWGFFLFVLLKGARGIVPYAFFWNE